MSLALVQPWIALAFGLGAAAFCMAALNARSLVISVLAFLAAGALIAASLLAFGYSDAALAVALNGAGLIPGLLLAGLLLSARTVKPRRARRPWFAAIFAILLVGVMLWVVLGASAAPERALHATQSPILGLAPMFLALATACVALLGFGERGAFNHPPADRLERDS